MSIYAACTLHAYVTTFSTGVLALNSIWFQIFHEVTFALAAPISHICLLSSEIE